MCCGYMCGWLGGWFVLRFPELRVDWRVYWWIGCMNGWFYTALVLGVYVPTGWLIGVLVCFVCD